MGNTPQNILIPSRFQMVMARLPNTVFFLTRVEIPGIEITELKQPSKFNDLPVPGDRLHWGPLRVTFVMDTKFAAWNDIFKWMNGMARPVDDNQYAQLAANSEVSGTTTFGVRPPYSDAIVTLYTSKNNPQARFMFRDCFPLSLDPVPLTYEQDADHVITCDVSFRYTYYDFEPTS